MRTVPIPTWVKSARRRVDRGGGHHEGRCSARSTRPGVFGDGMSPKVLWDVVRAAAARAGIDKLAPHDLRRTCARLCHLAGGELDQIQFLLGHVSIQTTERYLGCKQKLRIAVNDRLGISPMPLDPDHRQGGCFNLPWATTRYLRRYRESVVKPLGSVASVTLALFSGSAMVRRESAHAGQSHVSSPSKHDATQVISCHPASRGSVSAGPDRRTSLTPDGH